MKNKLNEVTDIRHWSAEAERKAFDSHIEQTLKKNKCTMVARETGQPADARPRRHEHSVLQNIPRQGRACLGCPFWLGCSHSVILA
jgi:hypothetical protein